MPNYLYTYETNVLFKRYPTHILESIIRCQNKEEMKSILKGDYAKALTKIGFYQELKSINLFSPTFLVDACEVAGIPIEILWLSLGFMSLGAAALWILGGVGFLGFALFAGICGYYAKKQQENLTSEKNNLAITEIKILVLNELIKRYQPEHMQLDLIEKNREHVSVSYKKSMGMAVSLTLVLGATYWGVSDILFTIGMVSATSLLVSPIGLAIAFGVAFLLAIAFAINHHQYLEKSQNFKSAKKVISAEVNERQTYLDVFKKLKNNKPININNVVEFEEKENKTEVRILSSKKLENTHSIYQNSRFFKLTHSAPAIHHASGRPVRSYSFS